MTKSIVYVRRDCMYRRREPVVEKKPTPPPKTAPDNCVKAEVARIIKAQNKVEDDCYVSCESSINQLRSRHNHSDLSPANTTIPFILYCNHTCQPFVGSGIFKAPESDGCKPFFGCVESPIFRAKKFTKEKGNCVILEILLPVTEDCDIPSLSMDSESDVCPFFPKDNPVTDFLATGICLTVELDSFNGITCLDALTPIPASEFPPL